jgi:hypothetical protein
LVPEDGGISLTAGTDSPEAFPERPGVDLDGIRRANVCGLGHEAQGCVTWEGKKLWLTGHSGASASHLQEAMQLLLQDPAPYVQVISHLVSYHTSQRLFEHLLAADPLNIARAPGVKVIIDFADDSGEVKEFEPQRWFSTEA